MKDHLTSALAQLNGSADWNERTGGTLPAKLSCFEAQDVLTALQELQQRAEAAEREVEQWKECHRIMQQSAKSQAARADAAEAAAERWKNSANFHRERGITLLDAKWLDPECHKGCRSLALKDRAEKTEAELAKLRSFYDQIVVECGHDRIVREYRQRGELLRDEANRRKEAQAELAAERARLDAMVANCWVVHSEVGGSFSVFSNTCGDYIATAQTYRAAIDAAMKEGTK